MKNATKEYELLQEKYDKLWCEKQSLEYELNQLKQKENYFEEQSSQILALHESVRSIKHDMKNHRLIIIDEGSKVYDGDLLGIREQYGTTRTLDLELQQECVIEPIKNVIITRPEDQNGKRWQLQFEQGEVQIQALMSDLLSKYQVKDMNIAEPEIESIIRKIYSGEVE